MADMYIRFTKEPTILLKLLKKEYYAYEWKYVLKNDTWLLINSLGTEMYWINNIIYILKHIDLTSLNECIINIKHDNMWVREIIKEIVINDNMVEII